MTIGGCSKEWNKRWLMKLLIWLIADHVEFHIPDSKTTDFIWKQKEKYLKKEYWLTIFTWIMMDIRIL